jgi:hypothetical protein
VRGCSTLVEIPHNTKFLSELSQSAAIFDVGILRAWEKPHPGYMEAFWINGNIMNGKVKKVDD